MQLSGHLLIISVSVLVTHLPSSFRHKAMKGELLRMHPYTPCIQSLHCKDQQTENWVKKGTCLNQYIQAAELNWDSNPVHPKSQPRAPHPLHLPDGVLNRKMLRPAK